MVTQTSLYSYIEVMQNGNLNAIYSDIMEVLRFSYGMTDREICRKLGYSDPNKIRSRRNELVRKGIIQKVGHRPCKVSGKWSSVWDISSTGNKGIYKDVSYGTKFPMEKIRNNNNNNNI